MIGARRGAWAGLALAAVLAAAGCGSSSGNGSDSSSGAKTAAAAAPKPAAPPEPQLDGLRGVIQSAAAKTLQAGALVDVRVVVRKPGASNILAYDATGTVVEQGGRLKIDRRRLGGNVQHEIFVHEGGRLVLYTNPPNVSLPAGKTWLKVDMTKVGERRYGANTTFLAGADQDPFQAVRLLESPVSKLSDLGQDWLPDRTLNTHYHGTVSVLAAAKAAGVEGTGLKHLRQDLGSPTQTIDVWVDKQGRIARIRVKSPAKAPDGSTLKLQTTTDFSAFGAQVRVAAPPATKTADYFALNGK